MPCHGPSAPFPVAEYHAPVVPPDPANAWKVGGTNLNTNASYVAAAGFVPAGASVVTYDLKSVDTWTDTAVTPNVKRPQITFKLKLDGTDAVFQAYAPAATPPVTDSSSPMRIGSLLAVCANNPLADPARARAAAARARRRMAGVEDVCIEETMVCLLVI